MTPPFAVAANRVDKGRLLMAGLEEEIRGLWDTQSRIEAIPVLEDRIDVTDQSLFQLHNWLRRALTTIRTLDHEIFFKSDEKAYTDLRQNDPRGITVRGLTGPRNNAVHHPEIIDPGIDRAIGPFQDGYLIFPVWVNRTQRMNSVFTNDKGKFMKSYATAYDDKVAGRALHDTLLDAFDFFDTLGPGLAHRDTGGQFRLFPLPPPPVAESHRFFRLMPDSPNESKQQAVLDVQLRWQLEMSRPLGRERIIIGAFEADTGEIVLFGFTIVSDTFVQAFYELPSQVRMDVSGGFGYSLAVGAQPSPIPPTGAVEVLRGLLQPDGSELPIDDLLGAGAADAEVAEGRWSLCKDDPRYYARFRRPH